MSSTDVVQVTQEYYNSSDADRFYATIWGGEDIHIGIYETPEEPISAASRRTVERMAALLPALSPESRVLDIGSGYGGSARYLARESGCRVTCLNLSEVQNKRNRRLNAEAGLSAGIDVIDGSFEDLPFEPDSYDVVWSQDAILHSGDRGRVLGEVDRVLRPGGWFIFTDPMQNDDCPRELLEPVLERIHLETMGSPGFYGRTAAQLGWNAAQWIDLSPQLPVHYGRVLDELRNKEKELLQVCEGACVARMKKGLQHWISAGNDGHLKWGIFLFQSGQSKPRAVHRSTAANSAR